VACLFFFNSRDLIAEMVSVRYMNILVFSFPFVSWLNCLLFSSIVSFNGGEDSRRSLLGCDAMKHCCRIPTFKRSVLPTSSG